jgi:hypothetical protein
MAKFSEGEKALFFPNGAGDPDMHNLNGEECLILGLAEFSNSRNGEPVYYVDFNDGYRSHVTESCLRKRRPPEQPADQDFQEWFKKTVVKEVTAPKEVKDYMSAVYRVIAGTTKPKGHYQ